MEGYRVNAVSEHVQTVINVQNSAMRLDIITAKQIENGSEAA